VADGGLSARKLNARIVKSIGSFAGTPCTLLQCN